MMKPDGNSGRWLFKLSTTKFGFVKVSDGKYSYAGATLPVLELMRKSVGPGVKIKAAGGIRTCTFGSERCGMFAL